MEKPSIQPPPSLDDDVFLGPRVSAEKTMLAEDTKNFIVRSLRNTRSRFPRPDDGRLEIIGVGPLQFWDFLSHRLKIDRDIAMAALVAGHVRHGNELPSPWNLDRQFFREAVAENSLLWDKIPEKFHNDHTIIRAITNFQSDEMVDEILEKFPELQEDREIWRTVLDSTEHDPWDPQDNDVPSCTLRHAPTSILSDWELMLYGCSKRADTLAEVDASLMMNEGFLQVVLGVDEKTLLYISHEAQRRFPNLMDFWIRKFFKKNRGDYWYQRFVDGVLNPALFQRTSFGKAWLKAGGPFLANRFPPTWRDEEEYFLLVAKYGRFYYLSTAERFDHVSDRLKKNLNFLLKLATYTPEVLFLADVEHRKKPELIGRALSRRKAFIKDFISQPHPDFGSQEEIRILITEIQDWLLEKMVLYLDVFMRNVLPMFLLNGQASRDKAPITLLHQDPDTMMVYKKKIAEYLGVPFKKNGLEYYNASLLHIIEAFAEEAGDSRPVPDICCEQIRRYIRTMGSQS